MKSALLGASAPGGAPRLRPPKMTITYTGYPCYNPLFIIIIIKRRSGINPIPPTVIDRD